MRQHQAVILRTQERLTFQQIAERLGCDVKNAHTAWKRGVEQLAKEASEAHQQYLGEQLAILDVAVTGLMPKVVKGDVRSNEALVRLLDHQAKLLGLYAPVRTDVKVTDERVARIKALAEKIAELDQS
ncbi:sigma factor-like helix-turn-helix DNA-binding protein [Streptomyces sp. NPDC014889]|uniref:sigma factor-like helix-turn-helix DNA-binding protein n=1 Tax=Streptomyces sp. NPDC014889 TaxID=3364928 RepID=UPI0036FD2BA3